MTHPILDSLLPNKSFLFETEKGRTDEIKLANYAQKVTPNAPELAAVYCTSESINNVWSIRYGWNPAELHRFVGTILELVTLKESAVKHHRFIENAITLDQNPQQVVNSILAKYGFELLSTQYGYLEFAVTNNYPTNRVKLYPNGGNTEILSIYRVGSIKESCKWHTDLITTLHIYHQQQERSNLVQS